MKKVEAYESLSGELFKTVKECRESNTKQLLSDLVIRIDSNYLNYSEDDNTDIHSDLLEALLAYKEQLKSILNEEFLIDETNDCVLSESEVYDIQFTINQSLETSKTKTEFCKNMVKYFKTISK